MRTIAIVVVCCLMMGAHYHRDKPKPVKPSTTMTLPLEVGAIGTLGQLTVRQVIDEHHGILALEYVIMEYENHHEMPVKVPRTTYELVWATVETKGIVSGKAYYATTKGLQLDTNKTPPNLQWFKVMDTKTYSTATGTKTIFTIKPTKDRPKPKKKKR